MNLKHHWILGAALFTAGLLSITAANAADTSALTDPKALVALLESDATPPEKAMACKRLAVYGDRESVPALAALLGNPELSSWARVALEVIPGPEVDAALRDALAKLQGRQLVGVIGTIERRRDAGAVPGLITRLNGDDPTVVAAAAAALGAISGDAAAAALSQRLASAPATSRGDVAEGCVLCAEGFLNAGAKAKAVKLYDAVRQADVPKHKKLEAVRGAILARGEDGLPLLLEQLRSPDEAFVGVGLRTGRELPGTKITRGLTTELEKAAPDRQALLVAMLGDRRDASVLPTLTRVAKAGAADVQLASVAALETLGTPACLPVLFDIAAAGQTPQGKAAKAALGRWPGKAVEKELLSTLAGKDPRKRQAAFEVAVHRSVSEALPAALKSASDPDPALRSAAVAAIGALGTAKDVPALGNLLSASAETKARGDVEKALLALCGRCGSDCLPQLLPLAAAQDPALRRVSLHALASVGGAQALATVVKAQGDADESVRDDAVRTLSTWPNNWPEDAAVAKPLLDLVRSGKSSTHRVLGLRGYLQYLQSDPALSNADKVNRATGLLPLVPEADGKQSVVAMVGTVPSIGAVDWLLNAAGDPALTEPALGAAATLAARKNIEGGTNELRKKALQAIHEKTKDEATRKKTEDALKSLQ